MKRIKYLIMDVDGTLTDGKLYFADSGELAKAFNIKDGYGIKNILPTHRIIPVVITGRISDIVELRCKELGILKVYQGIENKFQIIKEFAKHLDCVAFIGDDLNDYDCMNAIKKSGGIVGCPFDAVDDVKKISDYISSRRGGDGAVRDFIDWLITHQI